MQPGHWVNSAPGTAASLLLLLLLLRASTHERLLRKGGLSSRPRPHEVCVDKGAKGALPRSVWCRMLSSLCLGWAQLQHCGWIPLNEKTDAKQATQRGEAAAPEVGGRISPVHIYSSACTLPGLQGQPLAHKGAKKTMTELAFCTVTIFASNHALDWCCRYRTSI